jgi:hypothetical protein
LEEVKMERIRLDEAINLILDAVVNKLKEDCLLSEVNTIVRGDRARPNPKPPSIFVYADVAYPEHPPRTLAESWTLPVLLVSTVKNDKPEEGYQEATTLAAKARSAALKEDRSLGLRDFVQDVRSFRFEPSSPLMRDGSLFGSAAVIQVVFTILEP